MSAIEKRVIIDLDMGSDDYLALLMLLYAEKHHEVKIEAITCCMGNTSVENVVKNVIRLLELEKRTDIPVYAGAHEPLVTVLKPPKLFHGIDGFGDLEHNEEPDISVIKNEHAAIAINNIVNKNPKEISVICIGPLTNLALAIKLNRYLKNNLKDVWIMGGNYTGVGNCTPSAEFNFYLDPEAANAVLEKLDCSIFILPWETCLKTNLSLEWRLNDLMPFNKAFELLTKVDSKIYLEAGYDKFMPCDAFLSFCYLAPEKRILKQSCHHMTIELQGHLTRGQVVLDHLKDKNPNVIIIEDFDENSFKTLFSYMNSNINNS